jgi:hypothetical protein
VPATTLEQSVEEGFRTARATLAACGVSPTNCNPDAYAVPASPEHDRLVKLMEERVREGLVAAEGSGTRYDVIESIEVGADPTSAIVSYCYVDGRWLMVSNGTLDDLSDDILIDDSLTSLRVEQALKLTPAGWRVTETTVLEKWAGENKCGPEQ